MARGSLPKNLSDYLPILDDQGIPNVVACAPKGIAMQKISTTMPADGVIKFASFGLPNMADGDYAVLSTNHTSASRGALSALASRTATQLTLTGASTSDVIDLLIVGQLSGQLA